MNKKLILVFVLFLISIFSVYAITLTREATERVVIPLVARGEVCLWDNSADSCISTQEIVFGNAEVYSKSGDIVGMFLLVFNNNIYRSTSLSVVSLLNITTVEGENLVVTSLETQNYNIENYEVLVPYYGLTGRLSQVMPNGDEIYTTGDTVVFSDVKGEVTQDEPTGTFFVTYEGLEINSTPPNIFSISADSYENLDLALNFAGSGTLNYKLQNIKTTVYDLEWIPACTSDSDCLESQVCDTGACKNVVGGL